MRTDEPADGGGSERYRRQRRIQEATYAIAHAVTTTAGLDDLFARIHRIVGGLMEARNLYIALLDEATGSLSFPYFRDEIDAEPPEGPVPAGRGLTGYVLRTGEPLLASPEVFDDLVARGEVAPIGAASIDWLGVPLRAGDRTFGVLAVQSYAGNVRYGEEDQALLGFVSSQVALAIERRRAEEALRLSEMRHRAVLEALPDLLFVLDREGRYLAVHAARPEALAAPRESLLGSSVPEILPKEAAEVWMDAIRRCLGGGGMQVIEYELDLQAGRRAFEGRVVPHDADSVLSIVRDVTDRVERERELRERERELARLTENMIDVITETDLHGNLRFATPSYVAATGWSPEEFLGHNALEFIHPEDVELSREMLGRRARRDGSSAFTYRFRAKDGRWLWVDSIVTLAKGAPGESDGLVITSRDVTGRKRDEEVVRLQHETERGILRREGPAVILARICTRVSELFDLPAVWIGLKEPDGRIEPRAVAGSASGFVTRSRFRWDDVPEGRGPSGEAVRTGRPIFVDGLEDGRVAPWRDAAAETGLGAALSVPLVVGERVLGVLACYARGPEAFAGAAVVPITRIADQVALSLLEAEQLERIELQTAALEATANAVVITDREGRVEWANRAFTELTGFSAADLAGETPRVLKSGIQSEFFYERMWETILAGNVWRGELYNRRKDGTVYVEEQTITPVRTADGGIRHFVAVKQDVTQRRRTEERIRYLALHDPLTDLGNRRAAEESLERIVARARRGTPGSLLLLDLDHFKVVNDTLGHGAGDVVLVELARLLGTLRRPGDELARLGGDEFVLVLEGIPAEAGRMVAERVRRAVHEHRFEVGGRRFDLGVSVGVVPIDGRLKPAALLALADSALYAAKEKGRNRVMLFDGSVQPTPLSEASLWASRVKDALRERKFVLVYQPILRLENGRTAHYEALLRLSDGDGALVAPGDFLPAAEQFGLLPQVDAWVVDEVLSVLRTRNDVEVFVNLSGASLGEEGHLAALEERIRESGIGPGRLAFELTETTAVRDLIGAREWMRRLRDLGCRFALDDFGIGFSSFSYLQGLPADYVKIDGSFIRDLETNPSNRALVKAIDTVAHTLGKETIAEHVESLDAVAVLRELGVEYGQGFALGLPERELPGLPDARDAATSPGTLR
ncbi:MAG TPA: EAL domain-containing protein [Thermoanaerobaculia bacterium]|mgnify:CR=1 FL=1|nr:EAL domain-containing protein [Thermoanaerobaculia bacterium]HQN06109.1 EAL domain-containing protein [Thermoanaerobaculia bacterium]HQP86804.1 EAL domain-containing protein [Thermoanaerobaculia bacterium]